MRKFTITQSYKNGVEVQTIEADGFLESEEDSAMIFYVRSKDNVYSLGSAISRVGRFYNVEEITSEEISVEAPAEVN